MQQLLVIGDGPGVPSSLLPGIFDSIVRIGLPG